MPDVAIREAAGLDTMPLRQLILRPGQPEEACVFPFDDDPKAKHVIAMRDEHLVGVGSILPEGRNGELSGNALRIRGMAVLPENRGEGIGEMILAALLDYACGDPAVGAVWCNARVPAKGLYERAGFAQIGEAFELPDIGPHVLLEVETSDLRDRPHAK